MVKDPGRGRLVVAGEVMKVDAPYVVLVRVRCDGWVIESSLNERPTMDVTYGAGFGRLFGWVWGGRVLVVWLVVLAGLAGGVAVVSLSGGAGLSAGTPAEGGVGVLGGRGVSLGAAGWGLSAGSGRSLAAMPVGLQGAASSALGAVGRRFAVSRVSDGRLAASGGGLLSSFGRGGVTVASRVGGRALSLRALGIGHGSRLARLGSVSPVGRGSRVAYERPGVVEWYRNGPLGVEQGFLLSRRPAAGGGWLTISERLSGGLIARGTATGLVFAAAGGGGAVLRYEGLSAMDASGRSLPARLQLRGSRVLLRVDDARARYPVTIDPLVQQAKLTANDETGQAQFGYSVALSATGNTALIGGRAEGSFSQGAVWVFTRSGTSWAQQGPALDGPVGAKAFGASVALSSSGDTALIGAPTGSGRAGAAWVFTRSGTTWAQQGNALTGISVSDYGAFGESVALSGDGNTALIGAPDDANNSGFRRVFTRTGTNWTRGLKLTVGTTKAGFGHGVALSLDGTTALISAPYADPWRPGAQYWGFHSLGLLSCTQQAERAPPASRGGRVRGIWLERGVVCGRQQSPDRLVSQCELRQRWSVGVQSRRGDLDRAPDADPQRGHRQQLWGTRRTFRRRQDSFGRRRQRQLRGRGLAVHASRRSLGRAARADRH